MKSNLIVTKKTHTQYNANTPLIFCPQPDEIDRMFPTFSFSFIVASIVVAELAMKFHFRLVTPEDSARAEAEEALLDDSLSPPTDLGFGGCGRADTTKNFKMLTTPVEEIWMTVSARS